MIREIGALRRRNHLDSLCTVCLLQVEQNFFRVNLSVWAVRAFVVW
jgi:hypothetical protein